MLASRSNTVSTPPSMTPASPLRSQPSGVIER
jgi:hypothetical protein